jgi:hypothetical protein
MEPFIPIGIKAASSGGLLAYYPDRENDYP